ncbi:MAG TPA: hypothetical protein VGJ67_02370 [Actinomycetota bacterium]
MLSELLVMRGTDTMKWRGARFAVLLSAAVIVVSCTGSSSSPPAVHPTPSASHAGSRTSSPRPAGKAFDDGYAIWPQDTYQAAVDAPAEAWRDDPNAVAAQFATTVLGWKDARIRTLRFGLRTANVEAIESGVEKPLDVDLRAAPSETWSVLNVMPHGEYLPSVTVHAARASVGLELDGDAVSADVTVGYDGKDHTVTTHQDGTVHVDLGNKPRTSGHFLILARDAHGDVVSATGSTLPAGDFAAS